MVIPFDQISYNHWANLRLIQASGKLKSVDFKKEIESSFPSLQQTFLHILWGEELWLERWQGRPYKPFEEVRENISLNKIRGKFKEIFPKQIQFLMNLETLTENSKISYKNFEGETWKYGLCEMINHMILHSAYHRGQVSTLLRQLGVIPPCTDFLVYIDSESEHNSNKV